MKKERKVNMILAIVLWLICIAMFLPMVFVIINSFKTFGQVVMEPLALPEEWNLDNFKEVMKTGNYLKVFGNTIYFAVVSGVIVIALGAMAGYKLDRMNNRIGEITSIVFMIAMMLPFPVIMIPLAVVASELHISIPKELDECAYMDGASGYRFFFRIIFPLLKPITGTVAVLYFIRYWNDLMLPMILISKKELYTIPLSQLSFYNQFTQNRWNLLLASGLMAIIPVVIIYLFAQKTIISGVAAGAVKG